MGAQVWEIFRQGIWASLTGGYFYDPHQNLFSNAFHLYLWLFLLCFPFTLYLTFQSTLRLWAIYTLTITIVFIVIKLINYRLHRLFDSSEVINEPTSSPKEKDEESSLQLDCNQGIEMSILCSSGDGNHSNAADTGPIECSSRLSQSQAIIGENSKLNSLENTINDNTVNEESEQNAFDLVVDSMNKENEVKIPKKSSSKKGLDAHGKPLTIKIPDEANKSTEDEQHDVNNTNGTTTTTTAQRRFSSPGNRSIPSVIGYRDRSSSELTKRQRRSKASLNATPDVPLSPHGVQMLKLEPFPGENTVKCNKNLLSEMLDDTNPGMPPRNATRRRAIRFRQSLQHPSNYMESEHENSSNNNFPKSADSYLPSDKTKFPFSSGAKHNSYQMSPSQRRSFSLDDQLQNEDSNNKSGYFDISNTAVKEEDEQIYKSCSSVATEQSMAAALPTKINKLKQAHDIKAYVEIHEPPFGIHDIMDSVNAIGSTDDEVDKKPRREKNRRTSSVPSSSNKRNRIKNRRSKSDPEHSSSRDSSISESSNLLQAPISSSEHEATSHNDTSIGAIHYFRDENGVLRFYTFGDESQEAKSVTERIATFPPEVEQIRETGETPTIQNSLRLRRHFPSGSDVQGQILRRLRRMNASIPCSPSSSTMAKPKFYYKLKILPFIESFVKVRFDRLSLLALLDDGNAWEICLSISLAIIVGILGSLLLDKGFFREFSIFILAFVFSGCQYSLLKSVQPDAASPAHGYNRVIIYSRPFYFSVCAIMLLALNAVRKHDKNIEIILYGFNINNRETAELTIEVLKIFILCFPIIFTIGLLPQVNTFIIYLAEQVEIHVFGGNATIGIVSSIFTVIRSSLAVLFLYGFCYVGLKEKESSQHALFSIYCGLLVSICYHLSRSSSDPIVLYKIFKDIFLKRSCFVKSIKSTKNEKCNDEASELLLNTVKGAIKERLRSDFIICTMTAILVFAVHVSTAFSSPALKPYLFDILVYLLLTFGIINHYILPWLRHETPWFCFSRPFFRTYEWNIYEVKDAAVVITIEKISLWLKLIERNILCPAVFLCAITRASKSMIEDGKFSIGITALIVVVSSVKMIRSGFAATQNQYISVFLTYLFFKYDFKNYSEHFLLDYFFVSILVSRFMDFLLKLNFVFTYIAPWQITWGSAFHAFAQPFSVPHSAMLFVQIIVSSFFNAPLNPVLGSAIFFTSYIRPIKFWEKNYNTKRMDNTNIKLSKQLERNPGSDDDNLNSIFYEHLTRSLQYSLAGDLALGRWGCVNQGDIFILASEYLNALVHVIELGNGLVTFQLRGLEFRGTYCQQREVEAITESFDEDDGCCCCVTGHLKNMLSGNAAFSARWLAWEVIATKYVLESYSITDNNAALMLQVNDLRRVLIMYYVKSIIYYAISSPKLDEWLANSEVTERLNQVANCESYVDLDPVFESDDDYDPLQNGVSKNSFWSTYSDWITHCASRRAGSDNINWTKNSMLTAFCFCLSLIGRRSLSAASAFSHSNINNSPYVEAFLRGLHSLFKGDFRISCERDEWVFTDMEIVKLVIAPAIRIAVKLHQDHFTSPEEYNDSKTLFDAIQQHERVLVISHESDPAWRKAVLSNTQSLLSLRHVIDEGNESYRIIMLNKRHMSFRVIKINRECVRGLWAGQLHELVFLRNRNPERGSIQNAKQALRNMINSSCDQPIGYPIYVSPLTTSYCNTHSLYSNSFLGREWSFNAFYRYLRLTWNRMKNRCTHSCTDGSLRIDSVSIQMTNIHANNRSMQERPKSLTGLFATESSGCGGGTAAVTSTFSENNKLCQIVDPKSVIDNLNGSHKSDMFPNDEWMLKGSRAGWGGWMPERGTEGIIVHRWVPCHRDLKRRSHIDKTILLLNVKDGKYFVPIIDTGVVIVNSV